MSGNIDFEEYGRRMYDTAFVDDLETIVADVEQEYNVVWKPLGGKENNASAVKMLDADFVGGLAEIIFNGYDAVLLKAYRQSDLDEPPESISEAVDELIDVDEEQVKLMADGERSRQGQGRISLSVLDTGIGQENNDMEDTFLDLMAPGAQKKPFGFLQGQFGIGSTACLPHCEGGYKLVLTSRAGEENEWSVGLIRENPDVNVSGYEYLTIDGEVPSFTGTVEGQSHGTVVKLFEYDFGDVGRSKVTEKYKFRQLLERYVADPPFGLDVEERRDYSSVTRTTTVEGWVNDIQEDLALEESFSIDLPIDHPYFDDVSPELDVYVAPPASEFETDGWGKYGERQRRRFMSGTAQQYNAVMLTVNGQMHASLGRSFIRTCDLDALKESCVMHLDLSDVPKTALDELFSSSRNGIVTGKNGKEKVGDVLKDAIEHALREDDRINEINRSRTADIGDQMMSSDSLEEVMESFAGRSPALSGAVDAGSDLFSHRGTSDDEVEYNPPSVPQEMNIIDGIPTDDDYDVWDGDGTYTMSIPANSHGYVSFELAAPVGYFNGDDGGDCRVTPTELFNSKSLRYGGFLSVRVDAPQRASAGDTDVVDVEVTRPNDDPLREQILVNWEEAVESGGGGSTTGTGTSGVIGGISFPEANPVKGEAVRSLGLGKEDVVALDMSNNEDERSTVHVNLEAEVYNQFLEENNLVDSDKRQAVDNRYVVSMMFLATLKYHSLKEQDAVDGKKRLTEDLMAQDAKVALPLAFPEELLDALDA